MSSNSLRVEFYENRNTSGNNLPKSPKEECNSVIIKGLPENVLSFQIQNIAGQDIARGKTNQPLITVFPPKNGFCSAQVIFTTILSARQFIDRYHRKTFPGHTNKLTVEYYKNKKEPTYEANSVRQIRATFTASSSSVLIEGLPENCNEDYLITITKQKIKKGNKGKELVVIFPGYSSAKITFQSNDDVQELSSNIGKLRASDDPTEGMALPNMGEGKFAPPPLTSFGTSHQAGFNNGQKNTFLPAYQQRGGFQGGFNGFFSNQGPDGFQNQGFPVQGAFNRNSGANPFAQQSCRQQSPFSSRGGLRGGRGGVHFTSPRDQSTTSPLTARRSPNLEDAGEKPMNPEDVALLNKFLHKTVKMMTNESVDVKRQQLDPKSPLHSVLAFRELRLKEDLLRALDVMGYHQPSKIQEFALPLLLMEPPTNMIAQSQSGTGKTAAFVLTMLSRISPENKYPQAICLAPTYELAKQIGEVVSRMAKYMKEVQVHYAVKGQGRLAYGQQLTEQIIIGIPGRMIDYLTKMRCFDPSKIICLVLDEADVMIGQQGHFDLSHRIYNTIEAAAPHVQTMLFSATYDNAVMVFAEKLIKDAVTVTLKKEDLALSSIKQYFVECRNREAKFEAVNDLYTGIIIASSVIFTRTRSSANWLTEKLKERGHEVVLLHGEMTVQDRAEAIKAFKDGKYKVLITTNVCSRGIDVSQVTIVINYDLPYYVDRPTEPDYETYLHRIGRTGRFGKAGIAINFIDSVDDLELIQKLTQHFGKPIPKLDPSNLEELDAIEKDNSEQQN